MQIEVFPLRLPQLSWAHSKKWSQPQSATYGDGPPVPIHGAKQRSELRWIGDCSRMICFRYRRKGSTQSSGGISLSESCGDREIKDLLAILPGSSYRLTDSSRFNPLQNAKSSGGSMSVIGPPDEREDVPIEATQDSSCVRWFPDLRTLSEPFAADLFEGVLGTFRTRQLVDLALLGRINSIHEKLASFIAAVASLFQTRLRIDAK